MKSSAGACRKAGRGAGDPPSRIAGGYRAVAEASERKQVFGLPVAVAPLDDVIASTRAAGRPKVRAALPALEETLRRLRRRDGAPGERPTG